MKSLDKLGNSGENNHQKFSPKKKSGQKGDEDKVDTAIQEMRDLYIPREKVEDKPYSRDPSLKKVLLEQTNKAKAPKGNW